MQEWGIVSVQLSPNLITKFLVDLRFLYKLLTWNLLWFAGLAEQFQFHNLYKPRINKKKCVKYFDLTEEIIDLSLIFFSSTARKTRTGNKKDLTDLLLRPGKL